MKEKTSTIMNAMPYLAIYFNNDKEHIVFLTEQGIDTTLLYTDKVIGIWEIKDRTLQYTPIKNIDELFTLYIEEIIEGDCGFDKCGIVYQDKFIVGIEYK